jgi:ferrochelatase
LREFLSDPRVLDINAALRWFLVNCIIVPTRGPKSAKLYKEIWTEKGSPLLFHSKEVRQKLQQELNDDYVVELAMRYQSPSIEKALQKFKSPQFDKIIVIPLFPQYASASTGSVQEEVMRNLSQWQIVPHIEFINSYCDNPDFIQAWVERASAYNLAEYDHFVFSFHGLPQRQMQKADYSGNHCIANKDCCKIYGEKNRFCYSAQCYETARLIAERLGIATDKYIVTFQSRLGRDPWLLPYTDFELKALATEGKKRVLVFAPAFVSDCLETIYEIGVEYQELFEEAGGEKVQLVESLNAHPAWIKTLKNIVTQ